MSYVHVLTLVAPKLSLKYLEIIESFFELVSVILISKWLVQVQRPESQIEGFKIFFYCDSGHAELDEMWSAFNPDVTKIQNHLDT